MRTCPRCGTKFIGVCPKCYDLQLPPGTDKPPPPQRYPETSPIS